MSTESNLEQKENHITKYQDEDSRLYLCEIREKYDLWKSANENLKGPYKTITDEDQGVIEERVILLNEYKDFLDQQHYAEKFDSRSNLHSSVLEEFMYFLFKDLVYEISENALLGKSHSFKDIFFKASSFTNLVEAPSALIEKKDHDLQLDRVYRHGLYLRVVMSQNFTSGIYQLLQSSVRPI